MKLKTMRAEDIKILNKEAIQNINQKKYHKALKNLDQILEINPNNPTALCNKGVVLSKLGKHEKALRSYDLAINYDPNFEKAIVNRRKLLLKIQASTNRKPELTLLIFGRILSAISWPLLLALPYFIIIKISVIVGIVEIITATLILSSTLLSIKKYNWSKKSVIILIYSLILYGLGFFVIFVVPLLWY